uniref:Uncharacterized protein n=1 Tax=Oryza brachyantha TaxID=4533 RepID=J3N303_ORYBR
SRHAHATRRKNNTTEEEGTKKKKKTDASKGEKCYSHHQPNPPHPSLSLSLSSPASIRACLLLLLPLYLLHTQIPN